MDDVYENIDDYNPSRKRKILIVFDEFYHLVLCFCPERCEIKFNALFDHEN